MEAEPWNTYGNARFAYSVCYPPDLFAPQGEADNGDGQRLLAEDGAEMLVWGSNNALELSIDEEVQQHLEGEITYKAGKKNWRVASGVSGPKAFYYKVIQREDQFLSLHIRYDRLSASLYDPIVARISSCFRPAP
jgi:hypothetical protein